MRARHPGTRIAGVDEAGRGPLAGPVVAAAVILPLDVSELSLPVFDSKGLSAGEREELAKWIMAEPRIAVAIAFRSAACIDKINILRATHEAMREAVQSVQASFAMVDGLRVPEFPVPAEFIVKGDARSASIAAASIIAKTRRDKVMEELDVKYPGYGFASHKGYGTAAHLEALRRLGPCPEHRVTFAPVKDLLSTQLKLPF